MGRPIMHFEIASPNLERASDFYKELFDWEVGEEQMDGYRLVQTAEGSIGGGLLRTPEASSRTSRSTSASRISRRHW